METIIDDLMKIVNELGARGIVLNSNGIYDARAIKKWNHPINQHLGGCTPVEPFTSEQLLNADSILKAIKIIPLLVRTTSKKYLVGSYGMKHHVEKLISTNNNGSYMSNGQLILAMIYCGYKYRLREEGTWNCDFLAEYVRADNERAHLITKNNKIFLI